MNLTFESDTTDFKKNSNVVGLYLVNTDKKLELVGEVLNASLEKETVDIYADNIVHTQAHEKININLSIKPTNNSINKLLFNLENNKIEKYQLKFMNEPLKINIEGFLTASYIDFEGGITEYELVTNAYEIISPNYNGDLASIIQQKFKGGKSSNYRSKFDNSSFNKLSGKSGRRV